MEVVGIVAEFNPFHSGHKYLIDSVKKDGAKRIVTVMSGNFVQRCEPAFFEKHTRARVAIDNGVDLVVALPLRYSLGSAEKFASGAIEILHNCNVDTIAFGSETGNIDLLKKAAENIIASDGNEKFKDAMSKGLSFATARQMATEALGTSISEPNDILGVEYIKASVKNNYRLDFYTIKRTDGYSDSASKIRNAVLSGDTSCLDKAFVEEMQSGRGCASVENIERAILAFLRNADKHAFENIYGINPLEGIPERIVKASVNPSLEEVYMAIKSKRIAFSAVKRAVWNAFFRIPPSKAKTPYIQVLAASENGKKMMKEIAENSSLPIVTNLAKIQNHPDCRGFVDEERRATDIFNLALSKPQCGMAEFTDKICL